MVLSNVIPESPFLVARLCSVSVVFKFQNVSHSVFLKTILIRKITLDKELMLLDSSHLPNRKTFIMYANKLGFTIATWANPEHSLSWDRSLIRSIW